MSSLRQAYMQQSALNQQKSWAGPQQQQQQAPPQQQNQWISASQQQQQTQFQQQQQQPQGAYHQQVQQAAQQQARTMVGQLTYRKFLELWPELSQENLGANTQFMSGQILFGGGTPEMPQQVFDFGPNGWEGDAVMNYAPFASYQSESLKQQGIVAPPRQQQPSQNQPQQQQQQYQQQQQQQPPPRRTAWNSPPSPPPREEDDDRSSFGRPAPPPSFHQKFAARAPPDATSGRPSYDGERQQDTKDDREALQQLREQVQQSRNTQSLRSPLVSKNGDEAELRKYMGNTDSNRPLQEDLPYLNKPRQAGSSEPRTNW